MGWVENIVGKAENAGYQHFLLFPQCFPKVSFSGSLKVWILWQRVNQFYPFPFSGDGIPIILLVFSAGPVNISFADREPKISAIIQCFFPAQATGEALFNVITMATNDSSPAGRLPYTWYDTADQVCVWLCLLSLPFPKQQILDSSKLKEFADDNFQFDVIGRKFSKQVENTVGKGEIAQHKQFLLFPVFAKDLCCRYVKTRAFNGKGLSTILTGKYIHIIFMFASIPWVFSSCCLVIGS